MRLISEKNGQRGEAGMMFVLVAVVITIGIYYGIQHYQDRNHDITIHVPHVEVR